MFRPSYVCAFALMACCATRGIGAQQCRLSVLETGVVRVADGRFPTVNFSSLAPHTGRTLVVGVPAFLWSGADTNASRSSDPSAIGVLRDSLGVWRPVGSPAGLGPVQLVRAAAAADGGWHVIFVSRVVLSSHNPTTAATAEVWYSHFDGTRWRASTRIAAVQDVPVLEHETSGVVESGGTIAFALPFDSSLRRRSNAAGNQGVLVFTRDRGTWAIDTIRTWAGPSYVRLAADRAHNGLVIVFAQRYFEDRRPWPAAVFLSRRQRGWSEPRRIVADQARSHSVVALVEDDSGHVVAWQRQSASIADSVTFGAVRVAASGRLASFRALRAADESLGAAFLHLSANRALWLLPMGTQGVGVRAVLSDARGIEELGTVDIASNSLRLVAWQNRDGTISLLVGVKTSEARQPPAQTVLSTLLLKCPGESSTNPARASRAPSPQPFREDSL